MGVIFIFSICLNYVLRTSMDENTNIDLTITKCKSKQYLEFHIIDFDYVDDIVLILICTYIVKC